MRQTKEEIKKKYPNIPWLSDEAYKKALTQLSLQIGGVLEPLRAYGQDVFVDQATAQLVQLAEDFSLRCRGVDHPIQIQMRSKIEKW